jgi:hypothetical protein
LADESHRRLDHIHLDCLPRQAGGGLEIRITHHIGLMGDFAWNFVSGPDNDFAMARFGVTLSY